jgi:hypothetical protein
MLGVVCSVRRKGRVGVGVGVKTASIIQTFGSYEMS